MFAKDEKVLFLGSCFAANIGRKLQENGYDVYVNPFGTLFNPVSIRNSLARLADPHPFTADECVEMGAGAGKWCSWSHYTLFARPTIAEFLDTANAALEKAAAFYRSCDRLVLTFGTAWCFRHIASGITVSNCLKRPEYEFERYMLGVEEIVRMFSDIDREIVLTVSPIRHLADGAHGNQLSKSTLLLACDGIVNGARRYFPAYEIMMDELRDYRFYDPDGIHPSPEAIEIITDRFLKDF